MKRLMLLFGLISSAAWAAPDVVPTQRNESSQSDFSRSFATTIGADTTEAGSTSQVINATAHAAVVGDILRFTTAGSNFLVESHVLSTTTNTITLTRAIPAAPSVGNAFTILRLLSPSINSSGAVSISGGTGANDSVGLNGAPAPTSSTQIGFLSGANLVNVSSTNPLPISGSITASNPSVSATGAAVPAQATMAGGSDGTNLRALKVSATGVLSVDGSAVTQPVSGTFFQATQPVSAASLPLPAGASTSALQTTGNTSLASIDTKLTSPLAVTGTFFQATQPVSGTVAVTQSTSPWVVSGTVTATPSALDFGVSSAAARTAAQIGNATGAAAFGSGADSAQTLRTTLSTRAEAVATPLSTRDSNGTTFLSTSSFTDPDTTARVTRDVMAFQDGNLSAGSIAAVAQTVTVDVTHESGVSVEVTGTWTGTIQFEQSIDGIVFHSASVEPLAGGADVTQVTAGNNNGWIFPIAGVSAVRLRASVWTSGTATVTFFTSTATAGRFRVFNLTPANLQMNAGNFPTSASTNFGTPSGSTIRVASMLGLGAAAADQGAGVTTGQTLRVVLPTDQTAIPVTSTPSVVGYGSAATAQRTASQIGNTTGQADYNYGTVGAQTLRTASQLGNATGAALFGAGTTTAQVLRVVLPTDQTAIPVTGTFFQATQPVSGTVAATQSGTWTVQPGNTANTTPWLATINQGGNSATVSGAGALKVDGSAVTQPVSGTFFQATQPVSIAGTVTTTISGSALDHGVTSAALRVVQANNSYADSVYRDYVTGAVTTGAWTQLIASTAANINHLLVSDTCGEVLELGIGAAASETRILVIPRGGVPTLADISIPAGTRISLRALSATCPATAGTEITITGIN